MESKTAALTKPPLWRLQCPIVADAVWEEFLSTFGDFIYFREIVLDCSIFRRHNIVTLMCLLLVLDTHGAHTVYKCCLPFAVSVTAACSVSLTAIQACIVWKLDKTLVQTVTGRWNKSQCRPVAVFANGLTRLDLCKHVVKRSFEFCYRHNLEHFFSFSVFLPQQKSNVRLTVAYQCIMWSDSKKWDFRALVVRETD